VNTWPFWPYWEAIPACGLGAELVLALPPLLWLRRRLRRLLTLPLNSCLPATALAVDAN